MKCKVFDWVFYIFDINYFDSKYYMRMRRVFTCNSFSHIHKSGLIKLEKHSSKQRQMNTLVYKRLKRGSQLKLHGRQ